MKEAIVSAGPFVSIIDTPVPSPGPKQLLIKVTVSGSNPKDWKRPEWFQIPHNSGDDIAGIVESVGSEVKEFQKGDRVAALHEMMAPGGSYGEYALAYDFSAFRLPDKVLFQEAATIPLAAMTAALALYQRMDLPPPWKPATAPIPLCIYGGAGAVGSFGIKLAQASNIHPIIAIAGNSQEYVESLIDRSKGDTIVDYRQADTAVIEGIKKALSAAGQPELKYAFDAITEHNSFVNLGKVLAEDAQMALVLPHPDFSEVPKHVKLSQSGVASIFSADESEKDQVFGNLFFKLFERGLRDGWLKGHPFEVVPGGLDDVEKGLRDLKDGKNKASKYVFEIGEI